MKNFLLLFLYIQFLSSCGLEEIISEQEQDINSSLLNGLVLNLPFEGSANDTDISYINASDVNATPVKGYNGKENSAYAFDGIDDSIQYPNIESINFRRQKNYSISIWVKIAESQDDLNGPDNDIISMWTRGGTEDKPYTGGYSIVMRVHNQAFRDAEGIPHFIRYGGRTASGGCGLSAKILSKSALNDNNWHHYVFLKDENKLALFIDGEIQRKNQEDDLHDETNCDTRSSGHFVLGARFIGDGNNSHFKGG